jgi:hypothetical protein
VFFKVENKNCLRYLGMYAHIEPYCLFVLLWCDLHRPCGGHQGPPTYPPNTLRTQFYDLVTPLNDESGADFSHDFFSAGNQIPRISWLKKSKLFSADSFSFPQHFCGVKIFPESSPEFSRVKKVYEKSAPRLDSKNL